MAQKSISVSIKNGEIDVSPDRLVMTTQDDVKWKIDGKRRFKFEFDRDPGFGRSLGHNQAVAGRRPTKEGQYKYTVIAEDDDAVRLDPIIVVEEPETGEGGGT